LATLAAQYPLLGALRALFGRGAVLLGDGWWHAAAARAMAQGLEHGWIDASDGGFPVGPYYPIGGWLLSAALIRLGVSAATALTIVGVAGTVAIPLVFLFVARSVGARPLSALCGAFTLAWVSPYTYFVASSVSFVFGGLISQTVHAPIFLLWLRSLVQSKMTRWAPLLAALMTVAHPQVTIAGFLVVGAAILVARSRRLTVRYLLSAAAVLVVGVAMFGRGLPYKQIPFGWPPMETWRSAGFGPDMAAQFYLRADLLDHVRPPVITMAWALSLVALAATARRRVHAAVLAASLTAAVLTVCGGSSFLSFASFAPVLLQALMPARMLALVPLAAAAAIVLAADMGLARLEGWVQANVSMEAKRRLVSRVLLFSLLLVAAIFSSPGSAHAFYGHLAVRGVNGYVNASCVPAVIGPFDPTEVSRWVRSLDRGRFEIDPHSPFSDCRRVEPLRLESPVPVGRGAFPGIMMAAFANVRPWLPGSAARAETLGIREILRGRLPQSADHTGWRLRQVKEGAVLAERVGGTDMVGVGCIDEVWSGSDDALREALLDDLSGDARVLADPTSLVALEHTKEEYAALKVERGSCNPADARVWERPREPGAYEATVETPSDVDVVVRATDFATWRVTVDGVRAEKRMVAPGFFATRIGPGRHEVVAVFSPIPFYWGGIVLAFALVAALSWREL